MSYTYDEMKDRQIAKEIAKELIDEIKGKVRRGEIKDLRLLQTTFEGHDSVN